MAPSRRRRAAILLGMLVRIVGTWLRTKPGPSEEYLNTEVQVPVDLDGFLRAESWIIVRTLLRRLRWQTPRLQLDGSEWVSAPSLAASAVAVIFSTRYNVNIFGIVKVEERRTESIPARLAQSGPDFLGNFLLLLLLCFTTMNQRLLSHESTAIPRESSRQRGLRQSNRLCCRVEPKNIGFHDSRVVGHAGGCGAESETYQVIIFFEAKHVNVGLEAQVYRQDRVERRKRHDVSGESQSC